MKPKPIHIWTTGIKLGSGGIQAFSRAYIQAIAEGFPSHPVTVLVDHDTPPPEDPLRALPNVSIHSVSHFQGRLRAIAFAAKGLQLGLLDKPTCIVSIHLHFLPIMSLVRFLTGTRILSILHGIDLWHLKGRLRHLALRHADHLMAVSQFTRQVAIKDFALPPERVTIVPNTFDETQFQPGPKPDYLLQRHALTPDQPVLLTVGRLSPGDRLKGHRQVLLALPFLIRKHPTIRYIIGGSGSDQPFLSEMASCLGIADHVILTGQIPNQELPDYHRLADVFVMPGLKEGFGIVFLEAMASGKPVIAGNRDGSFDALDGGRLGALIDPFNAAQLAETADALLTRQHPNPLLSNPAALYEAVTAQFGFKRVASLMVDNLTPWVTPDRTPTPSSTPQPAPLPPVHTSTRVVVVTEFTSPYQIEFFNAIARQGTVLLEVIYMTGQDSTRLWERSPMGHLNWVLTDNKNHHWEASKSVKDADLVIFNTYLFSFALPALWKRARSGKPWAFWGERPGSLNTGRKGRLMRKILLHPLHRQPVPIWGMGQFGIEGYQAEYGSKRSYHNLPYASNLQRFFDLPDRSPSDRVFLFSGRFTERKGADLIAIAFARVAAKDPSAKLILVGSGPLESSMRDSLAPCANQVEWLGFQPWTEMPAALAKGAILCLPSRYDGWGLALVEGLAAGLPAIGTDKTGSAVELLSDHQAGWLIPANDADALANTMEIALKLDDSAFHAKQLAARKAPQSLDAIPAATQFLTLCQETLLQASKS